MPRYGKCLKVCCMYNNIANIFKLGLHQVPRSKEMSGLRNSFAGLHPETTGRNIQRRYIRQTRTHGATANMRGDFFSPRRNDYVATPAARGFGVPTTQFPRSQRRYRAHAYMPALLIPRGDIEILVCQTHCDRPNGSNC